MQVSTTKLKKHRTDKKWSQELLAKASGLSVRTIQRIEADGQASTESYLSIASALGIKPEQLHPIESEVRTHWKVKIIMKNLLALLIVICAIGMLIWIGSDIDFFFDLPNLAFIVLFTYALSIIGFGNNATWQSIKGFRYLFTDEIVGGEQANFMAKVFKQQIAFCYGGAFLAVIIGTISIHSNVLDYEGTKLHLAYAITALTLFYAALFCECLLRPIHVKLKYCDSVPSKDNA